MKRLFDIFASALGLIALSPLLLLIAAGVKLQDGGPVLFSGKRVGKDGRIFRLYKFRSMVTGADRTGAGVTVSGDKRITKLGRLLRNTKLDELPQLLNVLKGDMSFVGPRPEDPRYVAKYTDEQRQLLNIPPGITSPASLTYRSEESLLAGENSLDLYDKVILPRKLLIELGYLRRRSLWSDIDLILQTLRGLKSKKENDSANSKRFIERIDNAMPTDLRTFLLGIRNRHLFVLDLVIFSMTPILALVLRLNGPAEFEIYLRPLLIYTLILLLCKPLLCWAAQLYDRFWPYASGDALKSLAKAALGMMFMELILAYAVLYPFILPTHGLPRSVPVISALLTMLLAGSSRLSVRLLFELANQRTENIPAKPVVIAGAGEAGTMVVKALKMNPEVALRAVAFVDDDPRKLGARIHGVPVVGSLSDLPNVIMEHGAQEVIIAMPSASGDTIAELERICDLAAVSRRTAPGIEGILGGLRQPLHPDQSQTANA